MLEIIAVLFQAIPQPLLEWFLLGPTRRKCTVLALPADARCCRCKTARWTPTITTVAAPAVPALVSTGAVPTAATVITGGAAAGTASVVAAGGTTAGSAVGSGTLVTVGTAAAPVVVAGAVIYGTYKGAQYLDATLDIYFDAVNDAANVDTRTAIRRIRQRRRSRCKEAKRSWKVGGQHMDHDVTVRLIQGHADGYVITDQFGNKCYPDGRRGHDTYFDVKTGDYGKICCPHEIGSFADGLHAKLQHQIPTCQTVARNCGFDYQILVDNERALNCLGKLFNLPHPNGIDYAWRYYKK